MSQLIVAGDFTFQAVSRNNAPKPARLSQAMPFESQAIHVRWSGEGSGCARDLDFGVSTEHTSYPRPQIILYPAASAKPKFCCVWRLAFRQQDGQLAATIHYPDLGLENLPAAERPCCEGRAESPFEEA